MKGSQERKKNVEIYLKNQTKKQHKQINFLIYKAERSHYLSYSLTSMLSIDNFVSK